MATFGELETRIAQKLDNQNLSTEIKTAINATVDYYQSEHFWFQEARPTLTLTINDPVVPNIPTDFSYEVQKGGLVINDASARFPLKKLSSAEYDELNKEGQGRPLFYVERVDQLEVYPFPNQAYSLELFYVKTYADLVNTTDTNDFTTNAARLLEAKTLSDLYIDQRHDETRAVVYDQKALDELNQLKRRNKRKLAKNRLSVESLVGEPSFGRFNFAIRRF